jgi:hypothetical protein
MKMLLYIDWYPHNRYPIHPLHVVAVVPNPVESHVYEQMGLKEWPAKIHTTSGEVLYTRTAFSEVVAAWEKALRSWVPMSGAV